MRATIRSLSRSVAVVTAVALGGGAASAQTVVKIASVVPSEEATEIQGFKVFEEYVEFRSNGEIDVQIFAGTLGGEREITEQVMQGTLEMGLAADGAIAGFYKPIQVFSIPYLFPSSPVVWAFYDHPFARELAEDMREQTGIRVLTWAENGFRNFTNNVRPITKPEDMVGLKMRTMESPVYMRFMESLGASATPISAAEMVLALRQGVVDGQENATPIVHDFGLADVQKFMSIDEHILGLHALMINDAFYMGLPEDHRAIVADGARLYRTWSDARKAALHNEYVEKIRAKGLEVHVLSPSEKEAFKAASQEPVKRYIIEQVGEELVNELTAAVDDSAKLVRGF
ncbi:MAG TPA: TRAP transporter substrate-binding protein DctP [Geminicoccaceae bacterium]|nr:TRAP transporter substrate-binding protein DctP [Geminicoccaceae bacterium]